MRRPGYSAAALLLATLPFRQDACALESASPVPTIAVVLASKATTPESSAAGELVHYLGELFPGARFKIAPSSASTGKVIRLGTPDSSPELLRHLGGKKLEGPESYIVRTATIDGRRTGVILGADPAGVMYGVYGLLRHLGCGFYLSFDTMPAQRPESFSLEDWDLADRPVVPVRLVFNWHNFLSGCSTWNLEHWKKWIAQSQKMGYNAVMVHAYGNNPMAGFALDGRQKPVGYLSSTRVGRDWSTNHVNDVRRLWGGHLFDSPVFGSDASIAGTDAERTTAAQELMSGAFCFAERRGVNVYFAVDVDTTSANPQELIRLLPQHARFQIDVPAMAWMGQEAGKAWLVNPDTAEGYGLYKAQVEHLLDVYPQIDCLVVWHRKGNTPWMGFKPESMPEPWQDQYRAELAQTPGAEDLWHSHHLFAQAKIVRAFQRAVKQLGRDDVQIAFGSWDFDFLPAADRFLPEDVALIPLDWMVLRDASVFDTAERRQSVAKVALNRPVIPIAWAHHDDGNYVGRPYTPHADFYDLLADMKCQGAGYGIIHWTTRPLDLYFRSLSSQVWAASKNQPLEVACRQMAVCLIGSGQAQPFGAYLQAWVTTMPKIGRETSDFFIDHELTDLAGVEAAHQERMTLLESVDRSQVGPGGREWLDYFAGLERYVVEVYRTENAFHRAKEQYAAGDLAAARRTMAPCRPETVIEDFARHSQRGGLTRGEEGLVVTMNTRWLTHYIRFRQQLGMETIRYNFAETSHDPLAQSPGIFTFHFDTDRNVWQTLGTQETGCPTFQRSDEPLPARPANGFPVEGAIGRTGLEILEPLRLTVTPIMKRDSRASRYRVPGDLPAGRYRLTLLMLASPHSGSKENVVDLEVALSDKPRDVIRFPPTRAAHLRAVCRGSSANAWNSICEVRCPALVRGSGGVTASGFTPGYEPAKAVDGDPATRWATEGRDQWIQFTLDPHADFDRIQVDWYEGQRRTYDCDLMVSPDGKKWTKLVPTSDARRVTTHGIFMGESEDRDRLVRHTRQVQLDTPGSVQLTVTPVRGKTLLCGLTLDPIAAEGPQAPKGVR